MNLKAYIKSATLITLGVLGVLAALKFLVIPLMPSWLFAIPPALLLFSVGAFAVLARTEARNPSRFVGAFMGAIGGKMFLTLSVVAGYILLDGTHRLLVTLTIVGCYGIQMAHFTAVASRQLRRSDREADADKPS